MACCSSRPSGAAKKRRPPTSRAESDITPDNIGAGFDAESSLDILERSAAQLIPTEEELTPIRARHDGPQHRGWMSKQGGLQDGKDSGLGKKGWKRRWFVLEGMVLSYHDKPGATENGRLDIATCSAVAATHKPGDGEAPDTPQIALTLHDTIGDLARSSMFRATASPGQSRELESRVVVFACDTVQDQREWSAAIQQVIHDLATGADYTTRQNPEEHTQFAQLDSSKSRNGRSTPPRRAHGRMASPARRSNAESLPTASARRRAASPARSGAADPARTTMSSMTKADSILADRARDQTIWLEARAQNADHKLSTAEAQQAKSLLNTQKSRRKEVANMEGWMSKQPIRERGFSIKGWKKRWFKLHDETLQYFEKPGSHEKGRVNMSDCFGVNLHEAAPGAGAPGNAIALLLTQDGQTRTAWFACDTEAMQQKWGAALIMAQRNASAKALQSPDDVLRITQAASRGLGPSATWEQIEQHDQGLREERVSRAMKGDGVVAVVNARTRQVSLRFQDGVEAEKDGSPRPEESTPGGSRVWRQVKLSDRWKSFILRLLYRKLAKVRIPDIETSVRVAKLDVHFKMQGLHISDLTIPMDLLTMDSHREGDKTVMRLTATSTAELENVEWALTTRLYADQGMANIKVQGLRFVLLVHGPRKGREAKFVQADVDAEDKHTGAYNLLGDDEQHDEHAADAEVDFSVEDIQVVIEEVGITMHYGSEVSRTRDKVYNAILGSMSGKLKKTLQKKIAGILRKKVEGTLKALHKSMG